MIYFVFNMYVRPLRVAEDARTVAPRRVVVRQDVMAAIKK
jgi:hypothetical protein